MVALLIVGFCKVDVKLLRPLHEYVVPPLDVKFIVVPTQTVEPFAEAVGIVFIVATALFLVVEIQPFKLHSK